MIEDDAYHKALSESIRTDDRRMRQGFISAFSREIGDARTPAEAKAIQRRYLKRCRYPLERAQILRYGEMIHMWETMPGGQRAGRTGD